MALMVDLDDVRAQLRTAADGLQDEINELKAKEKRLTRARRSVEKAVSLLDGRE
jgi:FtsZ-binding cell division protein ZapB